MKLGYKVDHSDNISLCKLYPIAVQYNYESLNSVYTAYTDNFNLKHYLCDEVVAIFRLLENKKPPK